LLKIWYGKLAKDTKACSIWVLAFDLNQCDPWRFFEGSLGAAAAVAEGLWLEVLLSEEIYLVTSLKLEGCHFFLCDNVKVRPVDELERVVVGLDPAAAVVAAGRC
jgi:hypothetical protein